MFLDHEHTHQWQRIGVHRDAVTVRVVYQCKDCSAWTERALKDSANVPFIQGEVADDD